MTCLNNYLTSLNQCVDMKMTLKIARAELLNLFFSPVAWLVIIFYFIACGIPFVEHMSTYFRVQSVMFDADRNWKGFDGNGLTLELTWPVVTSLINNLYLFIPLLTMGIINREVNAGTIKLLYSSPISIRHIVFGKYLGLLALVAVLIIIISIFLFTGTGIITNPEVKRQFAYALSVFLVANAYIAIGIFISCVTNYQIVAGVLTFVMFFTLNSISALWQQYDFFRDITYFLSIAGRANYLLQGLISTRDIFYFILITVLFLGFAMIKLKSTQESKQWTIAFGRYSGLFIIVLIVGYLSARPGQVKYWDVTERKSNTITLSTQNVLKELDGSPLIITLYTNLLGANAINGLPQNRNFYTWSFWEQYRRFYPNMEFRYVYYYDAPDNSLLYKIYPKRSIHQIADKYAKEFGIRKSIFLKPVEIRRQIDLSSEQDRLVMELEYRGKKTWLRTFRDGDVWPGQEIVAGSISRLTRDSVPKILFTSGDFERSPYRQNERDYGNHVLNTAARYSLINLGIDADTISPGISAIPGNTSVLVVADPRKEMDRSKREKITRYLENGGNALLLSEMKKQPIINPVLQGLGINIDDGTVVHPGNNEMPHILNVNLTDAGGHLSAEAHMYSYQLKSTKVLPTIIEGGANISYQKTNGFEITPIIELKGDKNTWIERGILVVDSAAPVYARNEGDTILNSYIFGVSLKRSINNKEQRIIATGDADMLTDYRHGGVGNAFYSWLLENKYPFYANYPNPRDLYFTTGPSTIKLFKALYTYVIPAILLILATVLLVRRKRK